MHHEWSLTLLCCYKLYSFIQGRARFQLYQKLLALAAAVIQAVGQLTYIRPFVPEWDATWLAVNSLTLVAGAMVLVHVCPAPSHCAPGCVPMLTPQVHQPVWLACHCYSVHAGG